MELSKTNWLKSGIVLAMVAGIWGLPSVSSAQDIGDSEAAEAVKGESRAANFLHIINSDAKRSIGVIGVGEGAENPEEVMYYKGGVIKINPKATVAYAIKAEGNSRIDINVKDIVTDSLIDKGMGGVIGNVPVRIEGNIWAQALDMSTIDENDDRYLISNVNLALTTKNSYWHGTQVSDYGSSETAGYVNLWIQKGATWINESVGTEIENNKWGDPQRTVINRLFGGEKIGEEGIIYQKNKKNLQINYYKGNVKIIYDRTTKYGGTKIKGGSIIVDRAYAMEDGYTPSKIYLLTNGEGLDVTISELVDETLNNLAHKIEWIGGSGYSSNLNAYVGITEGITVPGVKGGIVTWYGGSGAYKPGEIEPQTEEQTKTKFTTTMYGGIGDDKEYVDAGVMKVDGRYHFTKDTEIVRKNGDGTSFGGSGSDIFSGKVLVRADKNLAFRIMDDQGYPATAIRADSVAGVTVQAENIDIHAYSSVGNVSAIGIGGQYETEQKEEPYKLTINSNINMNVNAIKYALGIYSAGNSVVTVNGNITAMGDEKNPWGITTKEGQVTYYGSSLLYAGSNYKIQKGATITVRGNVKGKVHGNGLFANGGSSKLTVEGGGYIEVDKIPTNQANNKDKYYSAIVAESGTASINVNLDDNYIADSARENDLILKGNVSVSAGAVHENEPELYSRVNLGLATPNSVWSGLAFNKFGNNGVVVGDRTFKGEINLFLQNGALWQNEEWGEIDANPWQGQRFRGSHVTNFTGGIDMMHSGIIYQNDDRPITFDEYRGYTSVIYKHNMEQSPDDQNGYFIVGGKIEVNHALNNSVITLLTDASGLETSSHNVLEQNKVNGTLNALAHKLWYLAYRNGETTLIGKVGITEGITSPAVLQSMEGIKPKEITFNKNTGEGYYAYDTKENRTIFGKEGVTLSSERIFENYENNKIGMKSLLLIYDRFEARINRQSKDKFNVGITGESDKDYINAGVKQGDGTYKFTYKNTNIEVTGNRNVSGIDGSNVENMVVDAGENYLNLSVRRTGARGRLNGVYLGSNKKDNNKTKVMNITAKKLEINIPNHREIDLRGSRAIAVMGSNNTINMHGFMKLKMEGYKGDVTGLFANGGHINIDGVEMIDGVKKTLKDSEIGYFASRFSAIKAQNGGVISINMAGASDVKMKGNIFTSGDKMDKNKKSIINMKLNGEKSYWSGLGLYEKVGGKGIFNLDLSKGAVWNNESWGNIGDKNIGSNVTTFIGGENRETAGIICQNDTNLLLIENYSGYSIIGYKHGTGKSKVDANGYEIVGGDIQINQAKKGSEIILVTDNMGISDWDSNLVNGTLNALAHKLYYSSYDKDTNLTAKVGIAEGLTDGGVLQKIVIDKEKYSVPKTQKLKDVSWTNKGQGKYEYRVEDDTKKKDFGTSITGQSDTDEVYRKAGIGEKGQYLLNRDIVIHVNDKETAGIHGRKNLNVSGKNYNITIKNENNGGMQSGVELAGVGNINIDSKALYIEKNIVPGDKSSTAAIGITAGTMGMYDRRPAHISITGDVFIHSCGGNMVFGIYALANHEVTINGNLYMLGKEPYSWGIHDLNTRKDREGALAHYRVNGIYAGFGDAKVHVNGDVNLRIKGTGIQANKNSEVVVTGGGKVRIARNLDSDHYALEAEAGVVRFHYVDEGEKLAKKDVMIEGNIGVLNKNFGISPNVDNADTHIYLGMNTPKSSWTGVAFNQFKEKNKDGGKIHLYLGNRATWTHQKIGKVHDDYKESYVYELIGDKEGGFIRQLTDSNLVIDKFSGTCSILLMHQNKGFVKEDYKAGDIHIKEAKVGSKISLVTDTEGNIDVSKEGEVYQVLNGMAEKLFYYGEKSNLTGYAIIAEGLTTPVISMEMGTISFNKENGQGHIKKGSLVHTIHPTPNPDPKPDSGLNPNPGGQGSKKEYLPPETLMMNGGKNAMALAVTMWLSNHSDLHQRIGNIRLNMETDGLWARYLGGKNIWNPDLTKIEQQYNIAQIGYDVHRAGWVIGTAFDYGTSNDTYHIADTKNERYANGEGKEKEYSISLYGSRQFDDGCYVDVILKMAKVRSNYTLRGVPGSMTGAGSMTGDYNTTGTSLSGEYGKRIKLNEHGYIEPSAGVMIGYMGNADYVAQSTFTNIKGENINVNIHQDTFSSLRGRLGIAGGYETEKGNAFAKIMFNKELNGDIHAAFMADGQKKRHPTTLSLEDTWIELEVGGSYFINKNTYAYADLTKSLGGAMKTEWRIDTGIRLHF